jgi:hypothetical protein
LNAIKKNKAIKQAFIYTTLPQRYGHMAGVPKYEKLGNIIIIRFYTPEHKNSFFGQFISYCYFATSALKHAYLNRKNYDCIFATSSRLGTGFLGYLISKITHKPLNLDIRDIFSDNLQSLQVFKGSIGQILVRIFSSIETRILSHAKWVNFVSPGFFTYPHIQNIDKKINLFTNGIDDIFLQNRMVTPKRTHFDIEKKRLTIIYAGNIGFGQGLESIVLPLAAHYKDKIKFQLIGDGSSVSLIIAGIKDNRINNIQLIPPVDRSELLDYYNNADIFLLQLNDIPAFKKVLPSKIFDYGSFDKPMLAGVQGVANSFIKENLPDAYLFDPGDVNSVVIYIDSILEKGFPLINNENFIEKYSRKNIMNDMLNSIVSSYNEKD